MMMDIDIEEIDDNSSQEDCPPATTAATKKRAKNKNRSKKESPAVASSTLTRFLGPSGPPSLSAWEDVNRQCPVCQQTGFSSRSLALHVNECLDVGSSTGAGARAGAADCEGESEAAGAKETQRVKKGAGTAARTRNAPTAVSTRTVGNAGLSNASHAAGSGSGEGVARKVPLAVPSKSKAPVSNGQAAKKAKTQQDGRGAAAERKRPGAWRPRLLGIHSCSFVRIGKGYWLWLLRIKLHLTIVMPPLFDFWPSNGI